MVKQQSFWAYKMLKEARKVEGKNSDEIIRFINDHFEISITKDEVEELKLNYSKYKKMYASTQT